MQSDVDVKAIRCFLALAQELSFGRAAKRMNLTQPSLSAQIRKLEEQIGQRLFDRTMCNDKFGSRVTTNEMAGFHGSKRKR